MLLTCTIDGVFVDLEVAGALGVMESIRKGTSNAKVVIFACVVHAREYTDALGAGANFLLRKPLNEDSIALHITIAKELLERERRRYFRHAASVGYGAPDRAHLGGRELGLVRGTAMGLHVRDHLRLGAARGPAAAARHLHQHPQQATLPGMAVRTARALKHNALIDFDFDLPARASVTGRGQVAWTNTEGMAGVILQNFRGTGRENLEAWLRIQEQLGTARKGS